MHERSCRQQHAQSRAPKLQQLLDDALAADSEGTAEGEEEEGSGCCLGRCRCGVGGGCSAACPPLLVLHLARFLRHQDGPYRLRLATYLPPVYPCCLAPSRLPSFGNGKADGGCGAAGSVERRETLLDCPRKGLRLGEASYELFGVVDHLGGEGSPQPSGTQGGQSESASSRPGQAAVERIPTLG